MANLEYTMNFTVKDGPQIDMPKQSMQIEAYDMIEVVMSAPKPPEPQITDQKSTDKPAPDQQATDQNAPATQPTATGEGSTVSQTVLIHPGSADKVSLMAITANTYDNDITFCCANDDGKESACIKLDAPKVFFGAGALTLLEIHPRKLTFTGHSLNTDTTIRILVGRTALDTPPS